MNGSQGKWRDGEKEYWQREKILYSFTLFSTPLES